MEEKKEQRMPQTSLAVSLQRTMLEKHGDAKQFMVRFNPKSQREVCADTKMCIMGDYPTLAEVRTAYGRNIPSAWLVPQLYDLSEYCGCKDKLSVNTLEDLADIISAEFYYLKISEVMLFMRQFKAGRYGRFYGSVDPLIIMQSLREFVKERAVVIDTAEQEKVAQKREEWQKQDITLQEWIEMKTIIAMYNSNYVVTGDDYTRLQRLYRGFHVNPQQRRK